MREAITIAAKDAARKAVMGFAPLPFNPVPSFGATREEWKNHQRDGILPSALIIHKDKRFGWHFDGYALVKGNGDIVGVEKQQEIAERLAPNENAWYVHGTPQRDAKGKLQPTIIAVIMDGSQCLTPYLMIGADKPGQRILIDGDNKTIHFQGNLAHARQGRKAGGKEQE
jgi:hypothetical protein